MDKSSTVNSPFRQKLHYFSLFIPFRLYLLLFVIGIALSLIWLNSQSAGVTSSFSAVLLLLTRILLRFGSVLITLSFLTVAIPWLLFMISKGGGEVSAKLSAAVKEMEGQIRQRVQVRVRPLLLPPFGFLRYRIVYDGNQISPKFSLTDPRFKIRLFSSTQEGFYNWPLPEIREYQVEKLVVYFEDIFQFFSFTVTTPVSDSFFTKPSNREVNELNLSPKKTEVENTRIDELRRVEGEYLNYKNFEDNDDVRRIVWKVYAKNKELVVRTPEVLDPFASHLYLYASYLDGLGVSAQPIVAQRGLNYFKTATWSVYNRLKKQGFDVRFIADQMLKQPSESGADEKVQQHISLSRWHANDNLKEYVNVKMASVVCISSLVPAAAVGELLQQLPKDASVIFIKLSNGFKKQGVIKWLRWIFLQEEKSADNRYLMRWNLSRQKRRMLQNERAVTDLLKAADLKVITI